MNGRVRAIMRKEFAEYRRNRLILITMGILPAVFLLVVVRSTYTLPATASPRLMRSLLGSARLFLLLIPLLVPSTIAAYSVIGEREQGALEPLLTTPATDGELLLAKTLAIAVPAVGLSWALYALYLAGAAALAPALVLQEMGSVTQIVSEILLAPAVAGFGIVTGLLISARSTDTRVAQQLAALAAVPLLVAVSLTSFRLEHASVWLFAGAAVIIFALDAAGWALAVRAFSRERLLARYGG
jgi:ABC-2 type transport system permease protein